MSNFFFDKSEKVLDKIFLTLRLAIIMTEDVAPDLNQFGGF